MWKLACLLNLIFVYKSMRALLNKFCELQQFVENVLWQMS